MCQHEHDHEHGHCHDHEHPHVHDVHSPEETLAGLTRVTEADISAFMEQWADVEQASVCIMGNYEG